VRLRDFAGLQPQIVESVIIACPSRRAADPQIASLKEEPADVPFGDDLAIQLDCNVGRGDIYANVSPLGACREETQQQDGFQEDSLLSSRQ